MLKSKFSDQEKLLLKVDIDYYASLPGQQKASPLKREIKNDFHIYILMPIYNTTMLWKGEQSYTLHNMR